MAGTIRPGLRDWWILLPPLSIGLLAWVAFLYAGVRARRGSWLLAAAGYFGVLALVFVIDAAVGGEDWSETLAGLTMFAAAAGGFVHAIAIRRPFYAAIGGAGEGEYGAALRRLEAREIGRKLVADEPDRARQMGVGRPDVPEAFDAELVDLNSAPATVIARVAGVSESVATRVVEAREATGGFSSIEDLDLLLDLAPGDVTRLKDAGVCVPPG